MGIDAANNLNPNGIEGANLDNWEDYFEGDPWGRDPSLWKTSQVSKVIVFRSG